MLFVQRRTHKSTKMFDRWGLSANRSHLNHTFVSTRKMFCFTWTKIYLKHTCRPVLVIFDTKHFALVHFCILCYQWFLFHYLWMKVFDVGLAISIDIRLTIDSHLFRILFPFIYKCSMGYIFFWMNIHETQTIFFEQFFSMFNISVSHTNMIDMLCSTN